MDGMPSSPTTKPCVHRYDGEKEKKARECCNKRTCSKRNQNEIPEKTIFDEVCLHKTMYCSGTQQNLQVLPEQRNVAIQQIFHNQPEYVERDNKNKNESNVIYRKCSYKHDDDDDDDDDDVDGGNKVSLGRFYLPEKYKTICLRIPVEETGSNKTVYSKRMETQNPAVCSCNCPVCSRKEIDERKRSVCGDTAAPNRKICPNKAITATTTIASAASNSISNSNRMKEYQKVEPKRVFIDSVPEIKTTFEKPSYVKSTSVRPQTSPKITTAPEKQKPDSSEKKSKSQKYVGTGLVRNSAFWKDDEPEAETPPASTSPPPSPSPKTSTKPKAKEKEKSKSKTKSKEIIQNSDMTTTIRRDSPVKAVNTVNALNYQTFHSDKPPVEIEPPKENIMSRDEEIALRKSRRRTQALTLQKSCMLRKTLNLDDSRTRLIYRTHISNTSSPFRSKSSERHYDKRNNYKYNDNDNDDDDDDDDDDSTRSSSDTIIVVPEACKQNIVDGPRFVTFSRSTRCKTIEDIDAKCRQLLQLNFEQADDDEF